MQKIFRKKIKKRMEKMIENERERKNKIKENKNYRNFLLKKTYLYLVTKRRMEEKNR